MSTETERDIRELTSLLARLTRVLVLVAVLALIYTCVNVTLFAVGHGTEIWIAWLLDPMVSIVLLTSLIVDGILGKWAEYAGGASLSAALLRWFAGLSTWSMNVWSSLWPDGGFGWPHHMDVGEFWIHSIPPILLILLAEASTAYRRKIERIIKALASKGRPATASRPAATPRAATPTASQRPASAPAASAASPASASPSQALPAPTVAASATPTRPPATAPASASAGSQPKTTDTPTEAAAGNEARDLDEVAAVYRALAKTLGRTPSDAKLAEALGVGRSRAQQLRTAAIEAGHTDLAKGLQAAS